MCAPNAALLSSFTFMPVPTGPRWMTGSPYAESSDSAFTHASSLPPTKRVSSPASMLCGPPLTAAST